MAGERGEVQSRQITGQLLRNAIGRSGMGEAAAMEALGLTSRSTYYAWRKEGVPIKDEARVASALSRWMQVEGQPQAPLSSYSNLDLLTELTRRLALLERVSDSESSPSQVPEELSAPKVQTGDALGPAVITGRGPSPDLGGARAVKDDQDDQ